MGFLAPWFLAGAAGRGAAGVAAPAAQAQDHAAAVQFADVLRAAHAKLHQAPPPALPAAVRAAHAADSADRAGLRASFYPAAHPAARSAPAKSPCWPSTIRSACAPATRLAEAKQTPSPLIAGLRPGERAEVLAFGSRVQVMSEVTDDHMPLNAAIDAVEPSDRRTSFAELARSLRSIAQSLKLPLDVHLFSDMQQTGMPGQLQRPAPERRRQA